MNRDSFGDRLRKRYENQVQAHIRGFLDNMTEFRRIDLIEELGRRMPAERSLRTVIPLLRELDARVPEDVYTNNRHAVWPSYREPVVATQPATGTI